MQAPQGAPDRAADMIVLDKSGVDPNRRKVARVPHFGKEAAVVADAPGRYDLNFPQRRVENFHIVLATMTHYISQQA
jgi:hypothetical protein